MRRGVILLMGVTLAFAGAACGGSDPEDAGGGDAKVTIADKTFTVNKVTLVHATGEDGYFRIEGDDAANPDKDCLPGLSGGLALYGGMPADVSSVADLAGKELPFEFTGDGDDFNLCFVGSNGLLGVEHGTVRIAAVNGTDVTFTFSGSFVLYDGQGGRSSSEVSASGGGIARMRRN